MMTIKMSVIVDEFYLENLNSLQTELTARSFERAILTFARVCARKYKDVASLTFKAREGLTLKSATGERLCHVPHHEVLLVATDPDSAYGYDQAEFSLFEWMLLDNVLPFEEWGIED